MLLAKDWIFFPPIKKKTTAASLSSAITVRSHLTGCDNMLMEIIRSLVFVLKQGP